MLIASQIKIHGFAVWWSVINWSIFALIYMSTTNYQIYRYCTIGSISVGVAVTWPRSSQGLVRSTDEQRRVPGLAGLTKRAQIMTFWILIETRICLSLPPSRHRIRLQHWRKMGEGLKNASVVTIGFKEPESETPNNFCPSRFSQMCHFLQKANWYRNLENVH